MNRDELFTKQDNYKDEQMRAGVTPMEIPMPVTWHKHSIFENLMPKSSRENIKFN